MLMQMSSLRVGIIGASGYTGAELLRLVAGHPRMDVVVATGDSMAGRRAADVYPSLEVAYPDLVFEAFDPAMADGLDVAFLGLPHEASMALAPQLVGSVGCVVDLSAAYRLKDASAYPTFYGFEHTQPELLAEAVFGLPELHRTELKEARLIATPGCHVTAATLALRPLVAAGLVEPTGIVVNTVTGITGAGRAPTDTNVFTNIDSNAVRLRADRSPPHARDGAGDRCPADLHPAPRPDEPRPARHLLRPADLRMQRRARSPPRCTTSPSTSRSWPSPPSRRRPNRCSVRMRRTSAPASTSAPARSIAMCAIDNLTKGASGGALQAANVALGLDETAGLSSIGLAP